MKERDQRADPGRRDPGRGDRGRSDGPSEAATQLVVGPGGVPQRQVSEVLLSGPLVGERRLSSPRLTVGSHPSNDVVLADPTVSRFHLELEAGPRGYRLRDLDSTNGTWLNGIRVGEAWLPQAASLRLGQAVLQFSLTGAGVRVPASEREELAGLVGRSPRMRELFGLLERAAPTDATVLVEGESGTGKELVAAALHRASRRAGGPFVVLDCAAVPTTLIESEFFGHERGAFTGAVSRADGRFREADGGTLFLDEIGELPLELQPKLLRVLESKQVRRLGATQAEKVDVRLVAATNRDLAREVNRGSFREDLYYRLAVLRVKLPALRERLEDLPLLVRHFVAQSLPDEPARVDEIIGGISEENWSRLRALPWRGNVRELRNFIERTLALSGGLGAPPTLVSGAGAGAVTGAAAPGQTGAIDLDRPFTEHKAEVIERWERAYLLGQLARHGNNVSAAARAAGLDRMNFKRLLRRYR